MKRAGAFLITLVLVFPICQTRESHAGNDIPRILRKTEGKIEWKKDRKAFSNENLELLISRQNNTGTDYENIRDSLLRISSSRQTEPVRREPLVDLLVNAFPAALLIIAGDSPATGTIVSDEGHMLTSWHAIEGKDIVAVVLKPERRRKNKKVYAYPAEVLKYDEEADLALIKIINPPENILALKVAGIGDYEVGQEVLAIGHPEGENWAYTKGTISKIRYDYGWSYNSKKHVANIIQIRTAADPGHFGGPLLNHNGLIIGVNCSHNADEKTNIAVSSTSIEKFLNSGEAVKSEVRKEKAASSEADLNSDGINDVTILDVNGNERPDLYLLDTDQDGDVNIVLVDSNENSVHEVKVNDLNRDGVYETWWIDSNEDGSPDLMGWDFDGDGVPDKYSVI